MTRYRFVTAHAKSYSRKGRLRSAIRSCWRFFSVNEVQTVRVISIGLIDRSPVHPREVFAEAVAERASGIIVAHNHPAGGVEPSEADVSITKQLSQAGRIVGIELLDHIIFNKSAYFSFLEAGRLSPVTSW